MSQKTWLWISVAVLYTIVISLLFFSWGTFYNGRQIAQAPAVQAETEENALTEAVPSPTPTPDNQYIIKESEGAITIYKDGEILRKLNVNLSLLPIESRRQLKEGITVLGDKQLAELLEDFSEFGE